MSHLPVIGKLYTAEIYNPFSINETLKIEGRNKQFRLSEYSGASSMRRWKLKVETNKSDYQSMKQQYIIKKK